MLAFVVHIINSRGTGVPMQLLYILLDRKRMKLGRKSDRKGLEGGTRLAASRVKGTRGHCRPAEWEI